MAPCSAAVALAAPHAAPRQCSRGPLEPCQVHGAIRCVLLGGQQQGPTRKGRQTRLARGRRRGTISKREKLLVTHQTQGGKKAYTNAGRRSPIVPLAQHEMGRRVQEHQDKLPHVVEALQAHKRASRMGNDVSRVTKRRA